MVDWAALALAFTLGLGTFLSPCAVALIPAYAAYYAGLPPGQEAWRPRDALRGGLRFGLWASAGVAGVFAAAGALVYWVRVHTDVGTFDLSRSLSWVAILVALVIVALGVLLVLDRAPAFTVPVTAPRGRAVWNVAAFGALYTLASLGCSLPLLFVAIAEVLEATPLGGLLIFVAYGAGLATLMLVASLALTLARERAKGWLRRSVPVVRRAMGLVLIGAGLYVLHYYARALQNL